MKEWLPIKDYARKVGKSLPAIYLDRRLGKIPEKNFRKKHYDFVMRRHRTEVLYDTNKDTPTTIK